MIYFRIVKIGTYHFSIDMIETNYKDIFKVDKKKLDEIDPGNISTS